MHQLWSGCRFHRVLLLLFLRLLFFYIKNAHARIYEQLELTQLFFMVFSRLENGPQFSFDVKTSLNISLVAFYPSRESHTYDLFASSVDKFDVLFVDLETG